MKTQTSNNLKKEKAIIIGGSMGGLLTALVLKRHFEKIIIIEKDPVHDFPESRKGQPQTRHLHGLLPSGLVVMQKYLPGLLDELKNAGAMVEDFATSMQWFTYGGYRKTFNIGLPAVAISRVMLECIIRKRVLSVAGIELMDNTTVKNLMTGADKKNVIGINAEIKNSGIVEPLLSDLVVDISGRGSKSFHWLKDAGYEPPVVSEVKVNIGYTTRIYKRDENDPRGRKWIFNTPMAPYEYGASAAFPIEGNRWIVTLAGWHGHHAPTDEKAFEEFARNLPSNDVYDLIKNCEPVSEIMQYKYSSSLRRHYEKMKSFPSGYLVMGDAFCSFNPVYGQGMTSAVLQAQALDELLQHSIQPEKLASRFFNKASKIIEIPWNMAVGEDFRYSETTGPRPAGIKFINRYISRVHRATLKDDVVCEAFLKVMSLLKQPASLFSPHIMWRVLRSK